MSRIALIDTLQKLIGLGVYLLKKIFTLLSKERDALIIIFIFAVLTRLPFISHPAETIFDETLHADYVIAYINKEPTFDIHPPLARMIFGGIANNTTFNLDHAFTTMNEPYLDFPFSSLRLFVVLLGILLPFVIFAIARTLGASAIGALVPALFVVFDGAFVIYARAILPDTLLLLTSFLGLLSILALTESKKTPVRLMLLVIGGVFLGAAISIKWTGLSMIALASLFAMWKREWRVAILVPIIAVLVYLITFFFYLSHYSEGGHINPVVAAYDVAWVREAQFPRGGDTGAVLRYIPTLHKLILRGNDNTLHAEGVLTAPSPVAWVGAQAMMRFWTDEVSGKKIVLAGNAILWVVAFFAFVFNCAWIAMQCRKNKKFVIDDGELLLMMGYLANYIPFFFIDRPMYLYHYFTALIFLFLLLPRVTPRIIHCISILSRDRYVGYALASAVCILGLISFVSSLPTTYGF